jgi:hypothetical protein
MKDIGKAFSAPFKDPSWVSKFVLAALFLLLSLLGIGIPVVVGYTIQVTQRVIRREESILPDWSDIGIKFVLGFKYIVVYLVYLLPVFILMVPVIGLAIATQVAEQPEMIGVFVTIYLFAFTLLIIPYSLILTALFPIIAYRFALRERISDALDVGAVFKDFRVSWQNTLVVALISVGIESFAFIGLFLFLIGIFFTIFYVYVVSAYMHGLLFLELPPERSVR